MLFSIVDYHSLLVLCLELQKHNDRVFVNFLLTHNRLSLRVIGTFARQLKYSISRQSEDR
jgi:hypothetical protein